MDLIRILLIATALFALTACGAEEQLVDTDGDGIYDHRDTDDDNDGYPDSVDLFPLDKSEFEDSDNDQIGNNADPDDDNDGIEDSEDAFPLNPDEHLDSDSDKIGNNADTDDDNDGYLDDEDSLPLDPTEHLDFDHDGIGDIADTDDDNDGVQDNLDSFPYDELESVDSDLDGIGDNADYYDTDDICHMELDGNGEYCYLTLFSNDEPSLFKAEGEFTYTYLESQSKILKLNGITGHFELPIFIDSNKTLLDFVYLAAHNRLYLSYDDASITFVNILGIEVPFTELSSPAPKLSSAGNFLAIESNRSLFSYDTNGQQVSNIDHYKQSNVYAWNHFQNKLYYFRDSLSPNDLIYSEIDQTLGTIVNSIDSPYHSSEGIAPPIIISSDGNIVLLGSGRLYNANLLTLIGSLGETIVDAKWQDNGDLVTISYFAGNTLLNRRSSNFKILEQLIFEGAPKTLSGLNDAYTIITKSLGRYNLYSYTPNDDSDNDGVTNLEDAFPLDVAASLDSDNDGYPDEWNIGNTEIDSTENLVLDVFPNDSACWLADHDDGEGNCDFAATMPQFTPDEILTDSNGTIYLFSSEHRSVYRWALDGQNYMNPINVGEDSGISQKSPNLMAYSENHNRLYFGYDSGEITFVDLAGSLVEEAFANTAMSVRGLAAVGNYVLAQDDSGAWESHHIYDVNGVRTDSEEWNHYSREYAWNEINNRVYFFQDSTSPNDILFEEIDQNTGEIVAKGESPYHGDYSINLPIRVSTDGSSVLLGSGDLYDASTLNWQGSVGELDDALWLENGHLITLHQSDSQFQLKRKDANYTLVESLSFEGTLQAVLQINNQVVIVRLHNNERIFDLYIANDDSDNDGVTNLEDAFPLDVAASLDTDNDGYPDEWNIGNSEMDSTENLVLDVFPNDSACWLADHDDGQGNCDFAATMPQFTPDAVLTDSNGTIYLFSSDHRSVYRWSVDGQSYMNPIYVGEDSAISQKSPNLMAYSENHNRLYFGYDSGEITFVDLAGSLVEEAFANTAMSVGGLAAVGNYVLAQDASGAWATHYIFDNNGNLTNSKDWNRYSREYAWNDSNDRVYFFRDGTSPNDLHYEEIDQVTGEISAEGETPYHSSANIRLPIRVINNGDSILLGSGKIYDANDLTLVSELDNEINDAVSFETLTAISRLSQSTWIVELISHDNFEVETNFTFENNIISLQKYEDQIIVIEDNSGEIQFSLIELGDNDGDSIPAWWEHKYGLSDDDPSDAVQDLEFDGVLNIDEFLNRIDPLIEDTDEDGLTDFDELNTYLTIPSIEDSDGDGLSDGDEILIFATNPLEIDSDGDNYSDSDELNKYETDPNDENSIPQAISYLADDFEGESLSAIWEPILGVNGSWDISDSAAYGGSKSLMSSAISHNQKSGIQLTGLFTSGTVNFYAKVDAESCCDKLKVYLNDNLQHTISNGDWQQYSVNVPAGEQELKWVYEKDGSVNSGLDAAWIDEFSFSDE